MSPKGFLHVPLQDHWWEQDSWVSKFDCTHCSAWWNSAWFSIPGSVRPSNWIPLRSSDPGSRNHVQYIPTLVHDFRFLDQYAPRIVPPFEAHIQGHETMYCSLLHPQWGIPLLVGTRFPINQKKYFDFLQDACIFLVRQIYGISQKVRPTNPIKSYLIP